MTPVSWLASWTETSATSRSSRSRRAVQVDQPVGTHRRHPDLLTAGRGRLHHGRMLDRADDHRSGAGRQRAQHGQVVGLGPARREGDAAGIDAEGGGHGVARLVHRGARRPGHLVRARRVTESLGQPGEHGRGGGRAHRPLAAWSR